MDDDEAHLVEVSGVNASEQLPDALDVLERAKSRYQHLKALMDRRKSQVIKFNSWPVGIAFVADQHIGNEGVDYGRLFDEARLIASTPNLYVVQVGDLIDNFIIGKLLSLRMQTTISIPEEWSLAKYYLDLLGPKLLASVSGNHEQWSAAMAGVDQLRQTLASIRPGALYNTDELMVSIQVGQRLIPSRIRHKWQYNSVFNPTHGIERAFERDQGRPFLLGVGAHTHVSGLVRQFNAGGRTGLAVLCGSYKVYDSYAATLGAPEPNGSTAIVVTFHPEYGMVGYDRLEPALEALR